MDDTFANLLSGLWNDLLSPIRLFIPHLSVLAHRTWPIALLGWFGLRLLIRSTGTVVNLGNDLLLFGALWTGSLLLYSRLGVEGSAIVHALGFTLLVLGCLARFASSVTSGSRNRRSWGS